MADLLLPPHEAGRKPYLRASHFQFIRAKQVSTFLTEKRKGAEEEEEEEEKRIPRQLALLSVRERTHTLTPRRSSDATGSKRGSAGDQGIGHPANIKFSPLMFHLCLSLSLSLYLSLPLTLFLFYYLSNSLALFHYLSLSLPLSLSTSLSPRLFPSSILYIYLSPRIYPLTSPSPNLSILHRSFSIPHSHQLEECRVEEEEERTRRAREEREESSSRGGEGEQEKKRRTKGEEEGSRRRVAVG